MIEDIHAKATAIAIESSVGKTIVRVEIKNDVLTFRFADTTGLKVWDSASCCCEYRHMSCDDTPEDYSGATFLGITLGEYKEEETGDVHEIQFLDVQTSVGVLTCQTHNEHNGYYGGFHLVAEALGEGK